MKALAILLLFSFAGCLNAAEPPTPEPSADEDPCWFEAPNTPCETGLLVEAELDAPPAGWFCRGGFGINQAGAGLLFMEIWSDLDGAFGVAYNIAGHGDGAPGFVRALLEIGDSQWTLDAAVPEDGLHGFRHVTDDGLDAGRMRFLHWVVVPVAGTPEEIQYGIHETEAGLWLVGYGDEAYGRAGPQRFAWNEGSMGEIQTGFNQQGYYTKEHGTFPYGTQMFYTGALDSEEATWPAWPNHMVGVGSCPTSNVAPPLGVNPTTP